jgi:hypothetical protein
LFVGEGHLWSSPLQLDCANSSPNNASICGTNSCTFVVTDINAYSSSIGSSDTCPHSLTICFSDCWALAISHFCTDRFPNKSSNRKPNCPAHSDPDESADGQTNDRRTNVHAHSYADRVAIKVDSVTDTITHGHSKYGWTDDDTHSGANRRTHARLLWYCRPSRLQVPCTSLRKR